MDHGEWVAERRVSCMAVAGIALAVFLRAAHKRPPPAPDAIGVGMTSSLVAIFTILAQFPPIPPFVARCILTCTTYVTLLSLLVVYGTAAAAQLHGDAAVDYMFWGAGCFVGLFFVADIAMLVRIAWNR